MATRGSRGWMNVGALVAVMTLAGCLPPHQHQASKRIEHPSANNKLGLAMAGWAIHYISLVELTDRRICVEFKGQRDFGDDTVREAAELRKNTVAVISTPGKESIKAPVTQARGTPGRIDVQFCTDNTIIGPETPAMRVVIPFDDAVYTADYQLAGGRPVAGAWGAKGKTAFLSKAEERARDERTARNEAHGREVVRDVVAAAKRAGVRCGPIPTSGMTKVECESSWAFMEIWDAYGDGREVEMISVWPLHRRYSRCVMEKSYRDIPRSVRVKGELKCHLEKFKFKQLFPSNGNQWDAAVQQHLDSSRAVGSELVRTSQVAP